MKGTPPNGTIYKFDAGYVNGIDGKSARNYSFYPNPVSDVIRISMPEKMQWANVQVFDLFGKEMLNQQFRNRDYINFGVKSLPNGIYILKLQNSETTLTHKFTKQ
jgi:hypothetical protein